MELALRKQVKQAARKDKRRHDEQTFVELQGTREGWKDRRLKRKPFVPNHSKMEDRHGKRVPYGEKTNAIAACLANDQWAKPETRERDPRPPISGPEQVIWNTTDITIAELKQAIANMKRNKATGPDNITAEQLKFLNEANQLAILALINRWWDTGVIDEELELANIIPI